MLRLSLLGPPVVTVDDVPVSFDTRKAVALLAVMAVESRPQPRERLAALLWPDADPIRARSALRRTLSVTAAAVGDALVAQRAVVALDTAVTSSDVAEFTSLVDAGDVGALRRATRLYRDDFLAGFSLRAAPEWEDWQQRVADALRRRLALALSALVDAAMSAGDVDVAAADAERWLALDPLHEPAHQALMRLYAWRGDRSAAMRQYRTCARILDAELGVEPLAETTDLYDAVRRNQLPPPDVQVDRPPPVTATEREPTERTALVVGRSEQLAAIRLATTRAIDAQGAVVAVVGPAGSGKTTLLRVATHDEDRDVLTVAVRCHPDESTLAYGVAIELLRGVLAQAPQLVAGLPRHTRAVLARLLPEVADADGAATDADDPAAVARLYAAVRDTLNAAGRACALVIDDAQWIDPASGDLLGYLARRVASTRLAIVIALASDTTNVSSVERAVADAIQDGLGTELRLRPFDRDTVRELVRSESGVDDIDVDAVMTETGGMPALVSAWLDAARRGDEAGTSSAGAVEETLLRRVHLLSQTAQQLVAAAAVIGGRIDPDVLRETAGRGDAETVGGVEEALRAGLLVELPGQAGYDIPFEALRRAVTAETTLARLRLLHHRAARALVQRAGGSGLTPAAAGAIAHHLRQAGRDDDAAQWHWRAAQEARGLHAHEEALADVRAALALGFTAAPARLLEGEVLIALGRYREAITALELAAAAADPDDADAVLVERRLADVHHRLGDFAVADVHLAAALDAAEGRGADADVATMLGERALLAVRAGDIASARTLTETALDVAARSRDGVALSYALNVSGVLAARTDDAPGAEKHFREALTEAERSEFADGAIAALNNLARLLSSTGRHDEALAAGTDALARGERVGDRHRIAALHANVADLLRANERHDESIEHLKQSAAMFAAVDDEPLRRPEIWKLVEW